MASALGAIMKCRASPIELVVPKAANIEPRDAVS
jgi:hypothetical protein